MAAAQDPHEDDVTDTSQPAPSHDVEPQASPSNPKSTDAEPDGATPDVSITNAEDYQEPAPELDNGSAPSPESFGSPGAGVESGGSTSDPYSGREPVSDAGADDPAGAGASHSTGGDPAAENERDEPPHPEGYDGTEPHGDGAPSAQDQG